MTDDSLPGAETALGRLKNWADVLGGFGAHAGHVQTLDADRVARCSCGDFVPVPVPEGRWRDERDA